MRRLAIPVLTLFALVGCVAQDADQEKPAGSASRAPAPHAPEPAVGTQDYTFRLPIARYSYTNAEYDAIEAAEHILAKRCMAGYSLDYEPPDRPPTVPVADRRYGVSDQSGAARYGYRKPPVPESKQGPELGRDELVVLYGTRGAEKKTGPVEYRGKRVLVEGCFGQAIKGFRKDYDYPEGGETASRISIQSFIDSQKDPAVRAGIKKWSDCMKGKGFGYSSPLDLLKIKKFHEGPVTDEEKTTARTDAACKHSTGLLETWFAVESRLQERMIAKDAVVLRKLRGLHEKKVAAARTIVTKG
ncbi:hypothetical protein [Streptomyces qinzhouensis]|uniref:Lipoprotein n=1 Tax=Streptomyces qinzhouensis TaxID=2599401 RepID=A0A5B8JCD7_9ACTN|nr:hypothetical protein [Streptomyces qinzhouensis]QDY77571.1 hypothetical protein FQU76_14735 [Streptomyces qinzhouensis]